MESTREVSGLEERAIQTSKKTIERIRFYVGELNREGLSPDVVYGGCVDFVNNSSGAENYLLVSPDEKIEYVSPGARDVLGKNHSVITGEDYESFVRRQEYGSPNALSEAKENGGGRVLRLNNRKIITLGPSVQFSESKNSKKCGGIVFVEGHPWNSLGRGLKCLCTKVWEELLGKRKNSTN